MRQKRLDFGSLGQIELASKRVRQIVDLEGLLQNRPASVIFRHALATIARREDEGAAARGQEIGDRIDLLSADIDVEQSDIDLCPREIFFSLACGNEAVIPKPSSSSMSSSNIAMKGSSSTTRMRGAFRNWVVSFILNL